MGRGPPLALLRYGVSPRGVRGSFSAGARLDDPGPRSLEEPPPVEKLVWQGGNRKKWGKFLPISIVISFSYFSSHDRVGFYEAKAPRRFRAGKIVPKDFIAVERGV